MAEILKPRLDYLEMINWHRSGILHEYLNMDVSRESINDYLSDFDSAVQAFVSNESNNSIIIDLRSLLLFTIFSDIEKCRDIAYCISNPCSEDMCDEHLFSLLEEDSLGFDNISVLRSFYLLLVSLTSDAPKARHLFKETVRRLLLSCCADYNVIPLPDWDRDADRRQIFDLLRESYEFEQFYMQRDLDSDATSEEDMISKMQILEDEKKSFLGFVSQNMSLNEITDVILGHFPNGM
jgi:hypothetical protein